MHRSRIALAVLLSAGLIATGCGSDDEAEPKSAGGATTTQAKKSESKSDTKSVRESMVECIEGELGSDVETDDSDDNRLTVKGSGDKVLAVVVIHSDAGAAKKAVAKTLEGGSNAVVFGRAEFIRRSASDTEAGVIANCLQQAYNSPG
jgi:hypothetical protein